MRKISILISILVPAAMVLAACGGEETATNLPSTQVPQTTVDATEAMTEPATEAATEAATEVATEEASGTPGVPVTGELNPARLSNELDFTVWSQDGEQIGEVDDMVLDLDNTRVAYVVVGTSGFLDLGERTILVPWDSLQLQTGTGQGQATQGAGTATSQATQGAGTGQATATSGTGAGTGTGQVTATAETGTGQGAGTGTGDTTGMPQNAFILQGEVDMFRNAPDFDLNNLPQMGQPAADWDADIRSFWESGGTGTGTGQATAPAATSGAGTGTVQATATSSTGAGTGTSQATATSGTGTGTGQATATAGTGTGQGTGQGTVTLQGIVLASEVLGSTVTFGTQGTGTGTGTGTGQGTAAPGTGSTGTEMGPTTATVEDMIVDTDVGEILYIVLNAAFTDAERWIPVPLSMFQFDAAGQGFAFSGDATMLQGAPFFEDGLFPDTTTSGWNTEFDTFWQNSGTGGGIGTGTGSGGAQATATP